ncbi:hypothetical protein BAE44_0015979 [Dichanthelium oligosanthes]|uniref:Uncharacterized protein n=1 Tax=Dichanthelium oligosanthes TaxID=888268 RepID=A0A1E5VCY0_9POAL|nr:hypothetical protein BAE44_0015979 [Dichanthelium oligosanthes]
MYKTVNSVYFDTTDSYRFFFDDDGVDIVDDLDDDSFSTTMASEEWSEAVINSLGQTSTDRLRAKTAPGGRFWWKTAF